MIARVKPYPAMENRGHYAAGNRNEDGRKEKEMRTWLWWTQWILCMIVNDSFLVIIIFLYCFRKYVLGD